MSNVFNEDTIQQVTLWFEQAVPAPTSKNQHTQLGVHFEEVGEMLESFESDDVETVILMHEAEEAIKKLAAHLKTHDDVVVLSLTNRVRLLDALCDQIVTATGVGHMYGFMMTNAMWEVNASNWSKFVKGKPIFDGDHKIQKGPDYFKADLLPFVPITG